ncbi:MAG: ThiF family adenylyltransferase [Hylemonella sp.]
MPADCLGEALRELSSRGFHPSVTRGGTRAFIGDLDCRGQPVKIEFFITDWDFLSYPPIRVLDGIDHTVLAPHINPKGWLCYIQKGSVVLDRYAPAVAIAQCLEQARSVLAAIKFDPNYRTSDLLDEFEAHWLQGQSTSLQQVLMGSIKPNAKSTNYWVISSAVGPQAMLADDGDEVRAIALAIGGEAPRETTCPCWLFRTSVPPAVPDRMPATVKELFKWLQAWDPKVYQELQKVLGNERSYLQFSFASFAVHTTAGWLGFGFDLNQVHRIAAIKSKKPSVYRQHLHGKGGERGLIRLVIGEIGPEFVHSRNLSFPDLRGKRIQVVGCGAIGSHVAEGLVRLGAGSGGGRLTLIDPELLMPENLGRHALGYPSLFKAKSVGLQEDLRRQFPLADIEAVVKKAEQVSSLYRGDLVVDATGEEALSELLNARRLDSGSPTPLLHAWIIGNGEGVQGLWAEGRKFACYRCCLLLPQQDRSRAERYPVLEKGAAPQRRMLGCQAFTPYAVGAPMAAAALAMEFIGDWLQTGDPSPRFRTRLTARANARKVKSQDASRLLGCPACDQDAA